MSIPTNDEELRALAFEYLGGNLVPERRDAFEAWCRTNPQARNALCEAVALKGLARLGAPSAPRRAAMTTRRWIAVCLVCALSAGAGSWWAARATLAAAPRVPTERPSPTEELGSRLLDLTFARPPVPRQQLEKAASDVLAGINPIALQDDKTSRTVELFRHGIRTVAQFLPEDPRTRLWIRNVLFHESETVVATAAVWYQKLVPAWMEDVEVSGIITELRRTGVIE